MNKFSTFLAAAAATIALPGMAAAATIDFDFTTLGSEGTQLNTTETVNGIVASGFGDASLSSPENLFLRNVVNDHGLGVCGLSEADCQSAGGDVNELDNIDAKEVIVLENTNGGIWTSLWVSSLDGNAGGTPETGTVLWSDVGNSFLFINSFSFSFGDFGSSVEGDILTLAAAAGFDATKRFLAFIAGTGASDTGNNDYLVWKGTVQTLPEPSTLGIIGLGLAGLGLWSRRRRKET